MEFKISNFNIMSDKHFDFYSWNEVNVEPEDSRNARYDQMIAVINQINRREKIDVMTFQEVTEHSIEKLKKYAESKKYKLYENQIKSVDRPILLATMIKDDLVNAQTNNIIDLTDNYQNFYNKNNYHSTQDDYFSGRAQVFYIISKNLIVVNVHAPGLPDGFVQELWYKNLAAFLRCGCMTNQDISDNCYPKNQNLKIILIGDFNVSVPEKIIEWTNENNKLPRLELFNDIPDRRNTSYHSGIKSRDNIWMPDPEPYQKVDHLIHTLNLETPELYVYVSNNLIDRQIIPYKRIPPLDMYAGPGMAAPGNGYWESNYDINQGGWPSDHTFNLYVFSDIQDEIMLGGAYNSKKNKTRKYRIIY